MNNLMFLFWSGFLFNLKVAKLPLISQPWKFKFMFWVEIDLKLIFHQQFSWYVLQVQRLLFIEADSHQMTFWWESPSHKNNLCSCKTNHENCYWNTSFRTISNQNTNLNFQGCHIYGNLATFKLNRNPDQKRNFRFFIFMVKNL